MKAVAMRGSSMKRRAQACVSLILISSTLTLIAAGCNEQPPAATLWNTPPLHWQTLPSLPDEHGFAGGYSGTLDREGTSYLMFAGGANFPDGFPWQGGSKQWYDDIYLFDGATEWKENGKLPNAAGYGLSISYQGKMYLIGGNYQDAEASDVVYELSLQEDGLQTSILPPLPRASYNLCGAIIGDSIYVAGGRDGNGTLENFWSLKLARQQDGWQELPTWPGPSRMLAISGVVNDEFFLFGGVELVGTENNLSRRYLSDAYAYDPKNGWRKLTDLPSVKAGSPSPAISLGQSQQLIVLAGSDGSLDGQAGTLREKHPGFPTENYIYDVRRDQWQIHSAMPKIRGHLTPTGRDGIWPAVTTNTVLWKGGVVVPSGEIKPGVRAPKILFAPLPD